MKFLARALFSIALLSSLSAAASDKPNVLLIFLDSFGWGEGLLQAEGEVHTESNISMPRSR